MNDLVDKIGGESAPLAAIGNIARRAIASNSEIVPILTDRMELFLLEEFLDESECSSLISLINIRSVPSTVYGHNNGFRTSRSTTFDPGTPIISNIDSRITDLLCIPLTYGEDLQGQHYRRGERFGSHFDYFNTRKKYWKIERINGQRTWTVMVYLNDAVGGETEFPSIRRFIEPRRGLLVAWNNLDEAGIPNRHSLHGSAPVRSGDKYIITKWFRGQPLQ